MMKRFLPLALVASLLGLTPALAADPVYNTVGIAGAVSGVITQKGQSAAGTWNWNFPTSAGTAGQALLSGGGGSTAMTWGSIGVVGGGTGRGTLTAHSILLGEGTSAINQVAVMSNGQILVGQTSLDPLPETLSGDCTLSASGVLTCTKQNGVTYPAAPSTNTVPVVTGSNTITYEAVPNAALANASTTVNGTICTLGLTCSPAAAFASIADGDLLANISGGSAAPVATALSDLLDYDLSGTQGAVLYRGASGWAALGPGTAGNFLKTQGAAANPVWAAAAGTTYSAGTGLTLTSTTFSITAPIALSLGGTHADLSATGGTHQVLQQSTLGGNVSVGQLACADLSDSAASCATDATNAANIGSGLLAVARGGTHLASGTSGGILAYTGTGTLASSGLLSANDPVIGGGAGVVPSSGTRSGNTTVFGTTTGTLTSGHCVQFDASGNLVDAGAVCGTGSGSVGTTGTPASGNLTKFSGSTTVTNGDLSGDVTTASALVTTVGKVNGVAYGTSPSSNTVPVVTGTNTVTYEAVPNAALANSSMTLAGHSVALGGTQAIACGDLSNGASGCSTATGTSGGTIPLLNGTNVWSGQQSVTPTTLSISTATFTPDGTSNNFTLTLVHASCPCTLANPSATPVAGTGGEIVVKQSATGSDTFGTWGSQYESPGGTSTLTLSTAANAVDILSYYVRDSTHIELSLQKAFSH